MKILILCNMIPGVVRSAMGQKDNGSGLWLDHVLTDLVKVPEMDLMVLCRGSESIFGKVSDYFRFAIYEEEKPQVYYTDLENQFLDFLKSFQPDVIHIWGTEYGHTLAMVNAAERLDIINRVVVSIQGLISMISTCYTAGLPENIVHAKTIRDFIRNDGIRQQQEVFRIRGELEKQALSKVKHVIGRTHWDQECTKKINPDLSYHFCNESLRNSFYTGKWSYSSCKKHSVFASSCSYPIKGFHFLLEAFKEVLKEYPDATITVPGGGYYPKTIKDYFRMDSYRKYLIKLTNRYDLKDKIIFAGHLSEEGMKSNMLGANVFVLPSVIENSPNSLGEAMLLGVPCIAADVGGVRTIMTSAEGILIRDASELAQAIKQVFSMEDEAEKMGAQACVHATVTHNPDLNLKTLLSIYEQIVSA